jgi:hypothetical protein
MKGGNINVVWSKGDYWSTGNADVFLSRSTDHGITFSSRNLSDNQGLSYFPEVGVDALGNINVLWLDDVPGGMLFSRSVNGGADFSTPKNVSTPPSGIGSDLPYLAVASAFKNKSHRRVMLNALADAEQALANGNNALAVSTLDDLLWHVSGCGARADHNDWIVDCTGQLKIRSSIQIIVAGLGGQEAARGAAARR